MHYYTNDEIEYLREITPDKTNEEITKLFNKKFNLNQSEKAIAAIRKRHKIKTSSDGRFVKGDIPPNKGTKGLTGANKTSFKKGNKPHNWVPIGSERVTKDGYIQVKVQEGKKQHNWKGKHIIIWEEHNGPLQKGYAIIFGDGDKRNFDTDNLIRVSRRELLMLNQEDLIQKNTELTKAAINIAKLKIKVQEVKKK